MALLDRQKVEVVLGRRFPGARDDQVAAAVNAIMGLCDGWEEVMWGADEGDEFRLFRRRGSRRSLGLKSAVTGTSDSDV